MFCVSLTVTTKEKPTVDTQRMKRRETYHYRKSSIHKDSKRGRKEQGNNKQPENSKMAFVNPYLSIFTLSALD